MIEQEYIFAPYDSKFPFFEDYRRKGPAILDTQLNILIMPVTIDDTGIYYYRNDTGIQPLEFVSYEDLANKRWFGKDKKFHWKYMWGVKDSTLPTRRVMMVWNDCKDIN